MRSRLRLGVTAVVAPLVALGAGLVCAAAPASAGGIVAATGPADQRVIVLLRDQLPAVPATAAMIGRRVDALRAAQAPVVAALRAAGTTRVHSYATLNALSATVSAGEEAALRADPAVAKVVPDTVISEPTLTDQATDGTAQPAATAAGSTNGLAFCAPANAKPQLNTEALPVTNTDSDVPGAKTARSLGFTGAGVKVAFIADGVDVDNPDFIRPDGSHVFVDYQDFSGEGTSAPTVGGEAFLDASSIAAQGRETYDVSHYGSLPLSAPCRIRIEGVAPGASLVGLKVFAVNHLSYQSNFLEAIDYAVAVDHVDVLNESFGSVPFPDTSHDVTKAFNDQAVRAGVTVTVSSGDAGVTDTIGSPASDPLIISTGASTTFRARMQLRSGLVNQGSATGYLNNNISALSSAGETEAGGTVDLVAPGDITWAACTPDPTLYSDCANAAGAGEPVEAVGGTSESAPLTAGAAALVIQAYRQTHRGASPTPALIKKILTGTATDIGAPADLQGAGLLNTYKAVQAAMSAPGSSHRAVGQATLTSTDQLDFARAPGAVARATFRVTNAGAATETVKLATRSLAPYRFLARSRVVLSDTTSKHATIATHFDNYEIVHFRVPAGLARLDGSVSYRASTSAATGVVGLTLIDPLKRFAGYSYPLGPSNYADAQVARPVAGVWTAIVFSRSSVAGGTTGSMVFGARGAAFAPRGTVTPRTLTLAPGASAKVTFTGTTPTTPGDASTSIVATSTAGRVSSVSTVPVVLRSVAQVTAAPQRFSSTVTGGNADSTSHGVTGHFQLQVPAGLPELNSVVALSGSPHSPFSAYLVSPGGEAVAFASSQALGVNGAGEPVAVDEPSAQLHVIKPAAGRWDLVVNFAPTTSGIALLQGYSIEIDGRPVQVSAAGLPTRAATKIPAGTTRTVRVRVHNGSSAPEVVFLDPRRNATVRYPLVVTPSAVTLPDTGANGQPSFLVPTDTSALHVHLSGTGPVTFDLSPAFGDPDLGSTSSGTTATRTATGSPLTQGVWDIGPSEIGPYGTGAAPTVTGTVLASVQTKMFDPTMTSATGDLWLESINPKAELTPVLLLPGETKTILVHITPTGKKGQTVAGVLYVDDANVLNVENLLPNGNQIAALPYRYTIG